MANLGMFKQEKEAGTIGPNTSLADYAGGGIPLQGTHQGGRTGRGAQPVSAAQTFQRQVDPKIAYDNMNRYEGMIAEGQPVYQDEINNARSDWDSMGFDQGTYPGVYNQKMEFAGQTRPPVEEPGFFDRAKAMYSKYVK